MVVVGSLFLPSQNRKDRENNQKHQMGNASTHLDSMQLSASFLFRLN